MCVDVLKSCYNVVDRSANRLAGVNIQTDEEIPLDDDQVSPPGNTCLATAYKLGYFTLVGLSALATFGGCATAAAGSSKESSDITDAGKYTALAGIASLFVEVAALRVYICCASSRQ